MGNSPSGQDGAAGAAPSNATMDDINRPFGRDEVSRLPLVSHYSYALMALDVYNDPDRRPLEPGWVPLMSANEVHLDKEGYFATAYVNDAIQHCVIAERGTVDALGIRAGVWMYFDEPTIQFALAEQFSKLVRMRLQFSREDPHGRTYTVSYTGHSLGAVLAACRAAAEHTFAITFESPGCKAFVEKTMHPFKAEDVDIITYLRPPNPINTLRPQCGFLVQLPTSLPSVPVKKAIAASPGTSSPAAGPTASPAGSTQAAPASGGAAAANAVASAIARVTAAQTSSAAAQGGATSKSPSAAQATGSAPTPSAGNSPTAAAASSVSQNIGDLVRRFQQPFSGLPNPTDYLRAKVLEKTLPELQQLAAKLEPILKELLDHTAQTHSIASIVDTMAQLRQEDESSVRGQDVILVWPSHLMQFMEYFNVVRSMEDPANQHAHLYAAYQSLLAQFYKTESRPRHKMPLSFFNRDAKKLIMLWCTAPAAERNRMPLSALEKRVMTTLAVASEVVYSPVLTAFQCKQLVTIVAMRAAVRNYLDTAQPATQGTRPSKL